MWTEAWDWTATWAAPINTTGRPVPLEIHIHGLLYNTLIYTLPIYVLFSVPASISGLRRRLNNRCHACGYSLDGLTINTCPECNWRIKRKKNNAPSDSAHSGPPSPLGTGEESKGS